VLTALDISNLVFSTKPERHLIEVSLAFAEVLVEDNNALEKLTFSGDCSCYLQKTQTVTVAVGMTVADLSGANLGESGVILLAAWLGYKGDGLVSLNVLKNNLSEEQAQDLVKIKSRTPLLYEYAVCEEAGSNMAGLVRD
jgi:hypothetical protein